MRSTISRDLAERNPTRMKTEECTPEMVASQATAVRGFKRIPYDGADQQFDLASPSDGGFLGRPQGWER